MERTLTASKSQTFHRRHLTLTEEFQRELVRKAIHMLIALVPALASIDKGMTLALLGCGTLAYAYTETLRLAGREVFIISKLTNIAQRQRDMGRFVLGPVTLGIGAMTALLLYPEPAASIAIYALAFGDSVASLVGKQFGRIRIPSTGGKTLAGSIACFIVVFFISYRITGRSGDSLVVALVATVFELYPGKDLDNIIMPLATGFAAVGYFI